MVLRMPKQAGGKVEVDLPGGGTLSRTGLSTNLEEADIVVGILRTSEVYHDSLDITYSFQVRGSISFSSETIRAEVTIKVHESDAGTHVVTSRSGA